jgi:hypothetical protein
MLVGALPAGDPCPIVLHNAVPDGLLQDADEDREAVLDGGPAAVVGYPGVDGAVNGAVSDHPDGQVPEGGHDAFPPACRVGIERLGL